MVIDIQSILDDYTSSNPDIENNLESTKAKVEYILNVIMENTTIPGLSLVYKYRNETSYIVYRFNNPDSTITGVLQINTEDELASTLEDLLELIEIGNQAIQS